MKVIESEQGCRKSCALRIKPTAAIMAKIESEFRHLQNSRQPQSLLKKYLTENVFNLIKNRVTCYGSTLLNVISLGGENSNSKLGVNAPDGESYYIFSEIFNEIIKEYHGANNHPLPDFGIDNSIINLDLNNEYIVSIIIKCNRSLCGYPFNTRMTRDQFKQMEARVVEALLKLTDLFQGEYISFIKINSQMRRQLIQANYLYHNRKVAFQEEILDSKYWPSGRGVFINKFKNFLVWLNIEDHLRIISREESGDLKACYRRFVQGVRKIEQLVAFLYDKKLGYLNFCPTYLGTGMELSVQMNLKNLAKHNQVLRTIAEKYNLEIHTECMSRCSNFLSTITYKPKIGMNEFQVIKRFQNAISQIIRTEIYI